MRGYLDTTTPIYVLVFANILNLLLDVVLIAGLDMGPMGAAIATTTAEWLSALLFLGVLAGKLPSGDGQLGSNPPKGKRILSVFPSLSIPEWKEIKPLVVASSSVFLRRTAVLQVTLSSAAAMAARSEGGAASVAAHQIAIQLWMLCSFVADALAAASQGLVAGIGRDDRDAVRDVSTTVFAYSLILGFALSFGLWIGTCSFKSNDTGGSIVTRKSNEGMAAFTHANDERDFIGYNHPSMHVHTPQETTRLKKCPNLIEYFDEYVSRASCASLVVFST